MSYDHWKTTEPDPDPDRHDDSHLDERPECPECGSAHSERCFAYNPTIGRDEWVANHCLDCDEVY
jgi:hypothetical protein